MDTVREEVSVMYRLVRGAGIVIIAGLTGLAGCGTTTAGSPGSGKTPAPASSTQTSRTTAPVPSSTAKPTTGPSGTPIGCAKPGSYLTAVRVGQHASYDRVVFQFSGWEPAVTVNRVPAVSADPRGTPVPLAGQSYLHVVFSHLASTVCPQPLGQTWTGPSVLTPYYPQLLTVSAAGDFEGYLTFGIGLAARGSYHVYTLTDPNRVVIDVSHVALGPFPGIWDATSWPQYWALQYSWLNGHQPWLSSPLMVVQAWAASRWPAATAVIHQVDPGTFKVTGPDGTTDTVTGVRPVNVPGPWVITHITESS
jgi:hypothetical protein